MYKLERGNILRGGRMKGIILILGLSMLLLAGVVLPACGQSNPIPTQGQPRLSFTQDSVDVGKIPPGVVLDYTFHFKNVGDAPLVIEGVSARALEGC